MRPGISGVQWRQLRTSIEAIEAITGFRVMLAPPGPRILGRTTPARPCHDAI